MSLRAFHIIFIIFAMLLSFGFAAWAYENYQAQKEISELLLAIAGGVTGFGLIVYEIWFFRKSRRIIL